MAIRTRVLLLLLFLFSSSYLTLSLYEDQVGLVDWHQQYIGKVKHAVFHTPKTGRKRVVVSTEENVVASLDLRRGEIFWRHVLGANDAIDEIDIALGKFVITLSSGGNTLRAWNLADGQMVWESVLSSSVPSRSLLSIPTKLLVNKDDLIFAYGGGYLHGISSLDGQILWKKELASNGVDVRHLLYPHGSNVVYALCFSGLSQFDAFKININNGELEKHDSVPFPSSFSGDILFLADDTAVALDSTRSFLVLMHFSDGEISFQKKNLSDVIPNSSRVNAILPSKLREMVALRADNSIVFIKITSDGHFEFVGKIDDTAAVSDSLSFLEDQQAFAIIENRDNKIELCVKPINDWSSNLIKESIETNHQRGVVHKVFLNNYIRTDRSSGFRALIVMEDHSLLLLQQGEIVWNREDGLGSIIDVTTSELPVEKVGVSVAKVEQNLFEWLKGHMLKLKGTLMLANPDDMAAIQKLRLQSSEKNKMTRDHNGFRKLIIVLTRAGKLFALHTGDGHIVWSILLNTLRKTETCKVPCGLKLYQWQVPHHHVMDENPSILVLGRCGVSLDSPGVYSIVDAYTGKELSSLGPFHSISQVIPLPYTDSTEQRLHLIIDSDSHAHLYPRNPEALAIFQRERDNVFWYSVEADNGILRGHAVKENSILEIADDYLFNTRSLWSIVFPSESEKITATSTRKLNEVVHTQAKVMADQDVMYKYISKNLLFVVTVAPKASGDIGSVTPDESWLVVYLIDTVTGRVLHRMTHYGSQGPVHAVFSENWVIYHYFNLRAHRNEMSVIEIYDQSRADNKDVLKLVLGKHDLTSPVSSYTRPEVLTKSQSYFFSHSVRTIAVTSTAKGITSKQLLIGTIGDQVLALDKRFLDPRRTLNPTQAEKEEGIIPLTDSLPIIPQEFSAVSAASRVVIWPIEVFSYISLNLDVRLFPENLWSYVTHALKVDGLRGIVTVPAKLESTTLVFAYGVDLFFTRLAPSKTYDSLTEDFSYALLLITIVALVVAIFVTWILSEKKELQEKWR